MTTIITRLYPDAATAGTVVKALTATGLDGDVIDVITAEEGAADRMRAARVAPSAAAAYARAMTGGQALLVVRAPFAPMGIARKALNIVDRTPSIDAGVEEQDRYIREVPDMNRTSRVMDTHPFFMSNPHAKLSHGRVFGRGLSADRPRTSAIAGGAYMSTKFWPMKLVSTGRRAHSAMTGNWQFSSMLGLSTTIQR
jgi:hypothetical protein